MHIGPVANQPQYEKVVGYLKTAQEEGATVAYGGSAEESLGGYFVKPTVLSVKPTDTVFREEVFGPVLSAVTFTDEEEALKLANDTPYGLAGAVDQGRAPGAPGGGQDPGGHRVDQRVPGGSPLGAVRRLQRERPRPGERGRSGERVHREQVRVVELTGGTRDPFTLG